MNGLPPDRRRTRLQSVRRVLAAVAVGMLGRALTYAAVDAFLLYVFGDPATDDHERLPADRRPRPREAAIGHRPAA
jgi:hypothetical protein